MGTVVSLDVREAEPPPGAIAACFAWLRAVDERFSTYRDHSEVSRFERGELGRDALSGDGRWVLERCEALRRDSAGAFDAWATGGYDPSALVKGWSVQRAADALATAGVRAFCLTAG